MTQRRLNSKRATRVILVVGILGLIELIGWGISHIPTSDTNFWHSPYGVPTFINYFGIGCFATFGLLLLTAIGTIFYLFYNWLFPKDDEGFDKPKNKEEEDAKTKG